MSARRRITVDYTAPTDPAPSTSRRWPPAGLIILCAAVGAWLFLGAVINFGVSLVSGVH